MEKIENKTLMSDKFKIEKKIIKFKVTYGDKIRNIEKKKW